MLSKEAAEKDEVMRRGYAVRDTRKPEYLNPVVEKKIPTAIQGISNPSYVDLTLADGTSKKALVVRKSYLWSDGPDSVVPAGGNFAGSSRVFDTLILPDSGEAVVDHSGEVYGEVISTDLRECDKLVDADKLRKGKVYIGIDLDSSSAAPSFKVVERKKKGELVSYLVEFSYGGRKDIHYAPGRRGNEGVYITDSMKFVPVKTKKTDGGYDLVWSSQPMDDTLLSKWILSAGGMTGSSGFDIRKKRNLTFDFRSEDDKTLAKSAGMTRLESELLIAERFMVPFEKAAEIVDSAGHDWDAWRVYESAEKQAFVTRMATEAPWITGHDPEINVKLDAPQQQVLSTFTPKRKGQVPRYGDHMPRLPADPADETDKLPDTVLFSKSPEEIAQIAQQYDMPHVLDHDAVGQLATQSFNSIENVRGYIPDMETGLDRYYRTLFLLRYRPSDFEEAYGKDALMEMENDISEIAAKSGDLLLRLIKRFDADKYSAQDS
jgi:hypothetical protein